MQRENTWLYEVNASPDLNERSQVTEVTKGKEAPRINNPISSPRGGTREPRTYGASIKYFVCGWFIDRCECYNDFRCDPTVMSSIFL